MRGLLALLSGSNFPKQQARKVLVVCSGELNLCARMVDRVHQEYSNAQITYVVPENYRSLLCLSGRICTIAELKQHKLYSLISHRRQRYDVTVLMLSGSPIFQKLKQWALLTNYRVLVIYDEFLDSFPCVPEYRSNLLAHTFLRLREAEWSSPIAALFRRIGLLPTSQHRGGSQRLYHRWIKKHEQPELNCQRMQNEIRNFDYKPKISIIMPVYNTDARWLVKSIESVRNQPYPHWELCICDDGSTEPHVRDILADYGNLDSRIKVKHSPDNQGISIASNKALSLATGEFIGLLDHDDELSTDAVYQVVKLLQEHPEAEIIYSDEDKLELDGSRSEPFFKPDWSPEYLLSCMYTGHLGVYRKRLVDAVKGFRQGFEGSQDYDLVLRLVDRTRNIFHIPKILYHWRKVPGSAALDASAKPHAREAGRRALEEHMRRRGITATVLLSDEPNTYRVRPVVLGEPRVSIIIPSKDNEATLRHCIKSIENKTTYHNYEIVTVDNNSAEPGKKRLLSTVHNRAINFPEAFNFSRLINFAALHAQGKYLVFLNDNTEVITPEWLFTMLEFCQLKEVGVVGAKLYYPEGYIQHAGIILGIRGLVGHSHRCYPRCSSGYYGLLYSIRNCSAVSAACMMVRREVFDLVGGFGENFSVDLCDVDFCLRVRENGFRIVWTPYAELYHSESTTRGKRFNLKEVEYIKARWGTVLANDPHYNPNLTLAHEGYGLRS